MSKNKLEGATVTVLVSDIAEVWPELLGKDSAAKFAKRVAAAAELARAEDAYVELRDRLP